MKEFSKTAVVATLVLCRAQCLLAGPIPMPLEAQLDLARDVVLGRITSIMPVEENRGTGSHCGRITVGVNETLKGRSSKTLQFLGVTAVDSGWKGAVGFHQNQIGNDGIWVIQNGWVLDGGPIDASEKSRVMALLKDLQMRKWSLPVHGLRAWAAVADSRIIFAVNNTADADLYVPSEIETGFVTASVTDQFGKTTRIVLQPNGSPSEKVPCNRLVPEETIYLHPQFSSIDLARHTELPPGKYSVVMSCKNDRTVGYAPPFKSDVSYAVSPWRGEVSAPAVQLTLASDGAKVNVPTTSAKPLTQEEISRALDHIKTLDRGTLHRALISDQLYLRAMAAKQLGEVGDFSSIPQLIAALGDESQHAGAQYPEAGMNTTCYWANDSLKRLTKHDFHFQWNAPKADREAAIKRWNHWYETAAKLHEALTTAWKQIQALKHPLLAGASNVKPSVTEDEHGLVHAEIEFVRNAAWEPKAARPTFPDPMPVDAKQPYIFIQVSLGRPSPQSQPHIRTHGLRVYKVDYNLLVTVAASDLALSKRVESILNGAFDRWRIDKPTSNVIDSPPGAVSPQ